MNNKKPPFHDLKNFLKQYNIFTASERKGIVVLSVVLLLLMAVLVALKFYEPKVNTDFSELDKAVKHFEELKRADSIALHAEKENTDTIHYPKVVEMFRFNPNTLPDSLWHVMGISDKQLIERVGAGGLSGKPLKDRNTEIVKYIHNKTKGTLPIIAVGGIFTTEDAQEKLNAGASLVQVYTGFVYQGPTIVKKICKGLVN